MTFRTPTVQDETGKPRACLAVVILPPTSVAVTPVVSASPDYSSGDSIGGVMTVAGVSPSAGQPGVLTYVRATSLVAVGADIDLLIFNANPAASTFTDNAAAVVDPADLAKIVGVVTLTSAAWKALSGTQVVQGVTAQVPVNGQAGKDIYVAGIARGAINLASAADLVFRFSVV
jgi:hypothetical protein